MPRDRILLVEDEPVVRFGIRSFLEAKGYDVDEAEDLARARAAFARRRPDAAVLDYTLPDGNALELLSELRSTSPGIPLVVLTGYGTIELAVKAIKEGAENFLTKPVELAALHVVLQRALEHQRAARRVAARGTRRTQQEIDPFLGGSAAARAYAAEAALALRSEGPILIKGETGSGKGILARWLHENGPRREEQMVDLNCAGLSKEFLESELFGHCRGAFTGAVVEKRGLFEIAHRSTLFLDEIGDLDPVVQPKLLKALEEKRFRRMGEVNDRQVDLLLIAASNLDLLDQVRMGRFRRDLYFRVSTIPIQVPPLRERLDDLPELARCILSRIDRDAGNPELALAPDTLAALRSHSWPGNLRELRNVLERAALRAAGNVIQRAHLRLDTEVVDPARTALGGLTLHELERHQIEQVLQEQRGRVLPAAEQLGIPRSTLYQKIKEYGIELARYKL